MYFFQNLEKKIKFFCVNLNYFEFFFLNYFNLFEGNLSDVLEFWLNMKQIYVFPSPQAWGWSPLTSTAEILPEILQVWGDLLFVELHVTQERSMVLHSCFLSPSLTRTLKMEEFLLPVVQTPPAGRLYLNAFYFTCKTNCNFVRLKTLLLENPRLCHECLQLMTNVWLLSVCLRDY